MRWILVLAAMAAAGSGCAQLGPLYYKPAQDFSFHPPAGWRHNPPEEEMTIFQSHHVRGHQFRPTMTVVAEETQIMTAEEYMEKQENELRKLPGYEPVDQTRVKDFGGWRLTYNFFNPHYKVTLTALTQLVLRDGRVYAVTCIAPKTLWRRYAGLFRDSLETFKFGPDAAPISEGKDARHGGQGTATGR